jgi:hypothetical protein
MALLTMFVRHCSSWPGSADSVIEQPARAHQHVAAGHERALGGAPPRVIEHAFDDTSDARALLTDGRRALADLRRR